MKRKNSRGYRNLEDLSRREEIAKKITIVFAVLILTFFLVQAIRTSESDEDDKLCVPKFPAVFQNLQSNYSLAVFDMNDPYQAQLSREVAVIMSRMNSQRMFP